MTQAAPLELLKQARTRFTQREIAAHVGKDIKTVRRWEKGETPCPAMLTPALHALLHGTPAQVEAQRGSASHFRFIDLFAGIGGIRMGFETHGGACVFTSEWNTFSQKTYRENFGENLGEHFANGDAPGDTSHTAHRLIGDIVSYPAADIPAHDVLLAGFPCQPFSIAGVSKKNALGRPHGFECATQGTLFFDVARIIAARRPAAFLLENVKNLLSHDKGRTFDVILQTLRDELGYEVHYRIVDGAHFTPQHRERIIIVGFREATSFSWDALELPDDGPRLASVLHKTDGSEPLLPWDGERFFDHRARIVQPKYTLTPKLWTYLQNYAEKHRAAGNGFGFGLAYPDSVTRTLSARYHKDGSEILVHQGVRARPRRLTPRECARLMGFPDTFRIPVSDTQAYRQFGNSVVMPVMREVARIMLPHVTSLSSSAAPQTARVTAARVATQGRASALTVTPPPARAA